MGRFGEVLGVEELRDGEWIQSSKGHEVGAFVLRAPGRDVGTLEDLLERALTQPYKSKFDAAGVFLNEQRPEGRTELFRGEDRVALHARLLKASFVVIGQYDRPEQGLGTIIEHGDIFNQDAMRRDEALSALLAFIDRGALGPKPEQPPGTPLP